MRLSKEHENNSQRSLEFIMLLAEHASQLPFVVISALNMQKAEAD
jgi:hypothetical protein